VSRSHLRDEQLSIKNNQLHCHRRHGRAFVCEPRGDRMLVDEDRFDQSPDCHAHSSIRLVVDPNTMKIAAT
jgi:hypothetical protein